MLLLIIILVLLFGGGGGYYGFSRWGTGGGLGIVGTVLLIVLIVYLLGGLRSFLARGAPSVTGLGGQLGRTGWGEERRERVDSRETERFLPANEIVGQDAPGS